MNSSARLSDLSSLVRSLKAPVTTIAQNAKSFIAGDAEGIASAWSVSDGAPLWSINLEPSVSSIVFADGIVAVAHGASITAVNPDDGAIIWTIPVDGACDFVVFDNQSLWVTSSVYEIEIEDYVACRIMRIEPRRGVVEQSIPLPSKAWTLDAFGRGCILGLGRPQPGIYTIKTGKDDLHHLEDSPRAPISHSSISSDNRMSFTTSDSHAIQIDQVGKIIDTAKDVVLAGFTHDGRWTTYNQNGEAGNAETDDEDLNGFPQHFTSTDEMTLLATRKPDSSGTVFIGKIRMNWTHTSEITTVHSYLDRTVLGCLNGEVLLLETNVLKRRITKPEFSDEDDSLIRARLRMLRFGDKSNTLEEK